MKHFKFLAGCAFVVAGLLIAGSSQLAGQGADVRVGTWKLNLAKSSPGTGPAPQSVTRTYEAFEGDGVKYTAVAVAADGKRTVQTYAGHQDGKDCVWTGSTTVDAISLKRNDARSFDFTQKKAGKVVTTGRNVVSSDGKTLYVIGLSNASGQPGGVQVYEKQ
jgi:hypothetical protein